MSDTPQTPDDPPFRVGMGVECCDVTYANIRVGDRTRVLSQHWETGSRQWLVLVAGLRGYWLASSFRRCRM